MSIYGLESKQRGEIWAGKGLKKYDMLVVGNKIKSNQRITTWVDGGGDM